MKRHGYWEHRTAGRLGLPQRALPRETGRKLPAPSWPDPSAVGAPMAFPVTGMPSAVDRATLSTGRSMSLLGSGRAVSSWTVILRSGLDDFAAHCRPLPGDSGNVAAVEDHPAGRRQDSGRTRASWRSLEHVGLPGWHVLVHDHRHRARVPTEMAVLKVTVSS